MLTIDGSTLEGGGQLTRLALCLAAITSTPVRIHSIRAGRSSLARNKPGLNQKSKLRNGGKGHDKKGSSRGQHGSSGRGDRDRGASSASAGGLKDSHLAALTFLSQHCHATVEGDRVGSTEVVFRPSRSLKAQRGSWVELESGNKEFGIELTKPGSVWLMFQAVFPFLLFCTDWAGVPMEEDDQDATVTLILKGGTNVSKAMTTEYMTQVFLPIASRIGLPRLTIDTVKRGWAGNAPDIGEVRVTIHRPPREHLSKSGQFIMPPLNLTQRGEVTGIDISIIADPPSTSTALLDTLTPLLGTAFPSTTISSHLTEPSGDSRRLYILLVAHTSTGHVLGADYLGGGGKTHSETEAKRKLDEACTAVVKLLQRETQRGGCVDQHMQDQLVVFQALARDVSRVDGVRAAGERHGGEGDVDENGNEIDGSKVESVGDDGGTLHTKTVRWVCEQMLDGYGVGFEPEGVCRGIGWNHESCRKVSSQHTMLDLEMERLQISD